MLQLLLKTVTAGISPEKQLSYIRIINVSDDCDAYRIGF